MDRIFFDKRKVTSDIINHYLPYFYKPAYYHPLVKTAEQLIPEDYHQMLEAIKQISLPTLIIWAKQDPVLPVEFGKRLNRDIKGSKLVIIDKCGHVPQEEKPETTAKSIIGFIEE
jgi:pimeloyl-ACP methyl ester carboxylesterase